jgi:hypothetical protein
MQTRSVTSESRHLRNVTSIPSFFCLGRKVNLKQTSSDTIKKNCNLATTTTTTKTTICMPVCRLFSIIYPHRHHCTIVVPLIQTQFSEIIQYSEMNEIGSSESRTRNIPHISQQILKKRSAAKKISSIGKLSRLHHGESHGTCPPAIFCRWWHAVAWSVESFCCKSDYGPGVDSASNRSEYQESSSG